MRVVFCITFSFLLILLAFAQVQPTAPPMPKLIDGANEVGLTVQHISSAEKRYIVESMSGSAGLIDCDDDGKLDIITMNGSTVEILHFSFSFRRVSHPLQT
jgi:hypothetical protein